MGARSASRPRPRSPSGKAASQSFGYRHRRFFLLPCELLLDELPADFARGRFDRLELELLDEFELELLELFELELLDEFELELLELFELELPAEAGAVARADSTARTTASGGVLPPRPGPSVAAAATTSPHAPSPAVYVFQRFAYLPEPAIAAPRFSDFACGPVVPGRGERSVSAT